MGTRANKAGLGSSATWKKKARSCLIRAATCRWYDCASLRNFSSTSGRFALTWPARVPAWSFHFLIQSGHVRALESRWLGIQCGLVCNPWSPARMSTISIQISWFIQCPATPCRSTKSRPCATCRASIQMSMSTWNLCCHWSADNAAVSSARSFVWLSPCRGAAEITCPAVAFTQLQAAKL